MYKLTKQFGVISVIRYRFGRTKGVLFRSKQLGEHGVKWDDLLAFNDGSRVMTK